MQNKFHSFEMYSAFVFKHCPIMYFQSYPSCKQLLYNKKIFGKKKNFLDFLKKYVALNWMMKLTEEDIELMNKEFISEEFATFESDIIYKIYLGGEEIYVFFLQEMQSINDFTMPFRLLIYISMLWMEHFNNTDENVRTRKEFRFPPVIPLVLYNGEYAWTAKKIFVK